MGRLCQSEPRGTGHLVKPRRIAVLGGGMLGVCTALELVRRGESVSLIEGSSELMQGASRWNEGKIHLGYLYAADTELGTAERLIPGALAFSRLVERHIGRALDAFCTIDDNFMLHRRSVVDLESFTAYAGRVAQLASGMAARSGETYLSDLSPGVVRRLSPSELAQVSCSDEVVAGFRVNEVSVSTVPIADLLVEAVRAEPRIDVHVDTWVESVRRLDGDRMEIRARSASGDELGPFDFVVNALWEGRPAVDATLGIVPDAPWSHRFRAAVFGRGDASQLPSAVLVTGPFGDVKRYRDGRVYLSWYPVGLLAEGHEIEPPRECAILSPERNARIQSEVLAALTGYFPAVAEVATNPSLEVHGGWVYAIGQGSLADRASTLHRRDRFVMSVDRGYISVDTAKYSIAPWLAERTARLIVGR
jgi:glycine/D-amino acid oxidase-like deaminating enzyme